MGGGDQELVNKKDPVYREIRDHVAQDTRRFHLYNRGVLLVAEDVTFDNRSNEVSILVSGQNGIADGINTVAAILDAKGMAGGGMLPEQYVEFEVIKGAEDMEALLAARKVNLPVSEDYPDDVLGSLHLILEILSSHRAACGDTPEDAAGKMPEASDIGLDGIKELVPVINMFNQELYDASDLYGPSNVMSFASREVSKKQFTYMGQDEGTDCKELRRHRDKVLSEMAPILPGILALWNRIGSEVVFTAEGLEGRHLILSDKPPADPAPRGILYPLAGAFRALVGRNAEGRYFWEADPLRAWEDLKEYLCDLAQAALEDNNYSDLLAGRSQILWSSLFLSVAYYKREGSFG